MSKSKPMFSKRALNLEPYTISKRFEGRHDGDWLFLDWNETTYEMPSSIKETLKEAIDSGIGVAYPDGDRDDVLDSIARFVGVDKDNLLVFNGSDSALKDCIECIVDPGDKVSIIEPEYSQIKTYVQIASAELDRIIFDNPFDLKSDDLLSRIESKKVLYLSNPSNPTGRIFSKSNIIDILETGVCLLLDEAYVEFADDSCVDLTYDYSNLIVFRTFSKAFGLAGLRLGYVVSDKKNIAVLKKNRNSKEINAFAQIAVIQALKNFSVYAKRINEIKIQRDLFVEFIQNLGEDIIAYKSNANFVVLRSPALSNLLHHLEENRILVRDRRGMHYMDNCARVSIGTPTEMKRVKDAISRFFSKTQALGCS